MDREKFEVLPLYWTDRKGWELRKTTINLDQESRFPADIRTRHLSNSIQKHSC